jgi:cell division protein ZapA
VVSAGHLTVKIYGESYPLRTAESASRLEELAQFVDARMREVAASGKVVVTSKIAVLAALYIADELFRLRETPVPAPAPADLEQRLLRLAQTLDRALEPPPESAENSPVSPCLSPP